MVAQPANKVNSTIFVPGFRFLFSPEAALLISRVDLSRFLHFAYSIIVLLLLSSALLNLPKSIHISCNREPYVFAGFPLNRNAKRVHSPAASSIKEKTLIDA